MPDRPQSNDLKPGTTVAGAVSAPPLQRGPGNRSSDMRDAMAELAERAQLISQEAGTKIAAAMKDVISAAAGIAGFAVESARDLVQYMVRRGQMTQDEADRLIREAEEAHGRKPAGERSRPSVSKIASDRVATAKAESAARDAALRESSPRVDAIHLPATTQPAAKIAPSSSASKSSAAKRPAAASAASKPVKKSASRPAASEKKSASKKASPKKRR